MQILSSRLRGARGYGANISFLSMMIHMNVIQAFKILELPPTATQIEVKASFRRLAKKWHPDVNSNDTTKKFQRINEAYEVAYPYAIRNKKPQFSPPAKTKPKQPVKNKRPTVYTRNNTSTTKTTDSSSNFGGWLIIGSVALLLLMLMVPGLQLILLILILYGVTRIL